MKKAIKAKGGTKAKKYDNMCAVYDTNLQYLTTSNYYYFSYHILIIGNARSTNLPNKALKTNAMPS